jgi:hypothetical protein
MAAANNVIVLATKNCCLLRWNLEGTAESEEIEISRRTEVLHAQRHLTFAHFRFQDDIHRVFLDSTGSHTIISLKNGDNFYLHSRSQRPKKVSKLQGVVESISFDRQQGTETNTKSFLVGTSSGYIYELAFDSSGKEKTCQQVFQIDKQQPITGLHIETYAAQEGGASVTAAPGTSSTAGAPGDVVLTRVFAMCVTPSPTRLYLFLGGPGMKHS